MKNIYDAFSEIISNHINFYMTKKEFDEAWKKVTKEMSIRYKKRGKELCSSKEEIDDVIKWYNVGKTKKEVELENKVKELEEKIKGYESEVTRLNTKVSNLEYKLSSKKNTELEKVELEKKINRIEKKIREYENEKYEEVDKDNRRFREYEKWANSIEGISEWGDYVRDIVECEAKERREMEKLERLF